MTFARSSRGSAMLKTKDMKKYYAQITVLFLLLISSMSYGQSIIFGITNKTITSSSVTFDVTLVSSSSFKLGSGLLYFNYNTAAFGESVQAAGKIMISNPSGSVLGETVFGGAFPVYQAPLINDNTASRFAISWQQFISSTLIPADNITTTEAILFRVTIEFTVGGSSQPDEICFESSDVFDDQTFTACGPAPPPANQTVPSCFDSPGIQLTQDSYNCNLGGLPVELTYFEARPTEEEQVALSWQTEAEIDNDYFIVEHATDESGFKYLLKVEGAGTYQGTLNYKAYHENPALGNNYYRLRQVDFDGTFSLSDIEQVFFDPRNADQDINVFPNPTSSNLQVQFTKLLEGDGEVRLYNYLGQLVQRYDLESGASGSELYLGDLPKGSYVLEVKYEGTSTKKKILLQ